jgi:hypothetical protein
MTPRNGNGCGQFGPGEDAAGETSTWFDLTEQRRRIGPFNTGGRIRPAAGRVTWVEPAHNGWTVHGVDSQGGSISWTVNEVVLAAGAIGTTEILLRSGAAGLPLSDCVGDRFCANASSLAWSGDDVAAWLSPVEGSAASDSERSRDREVGRRNRLSPFRDIVPSACNEDLGYSRLYWDDGVRVDWYQRAHDQVLGSALRYVPFASSAWRDLPVSLLPTGGCCAAEVAEDGVVNGAGQVFCEDRGPRVHAGLSVVDASLFSVPEAADLRNLKSAICDHVVAAVVAQGDLAP